MGSSSSYQAPLWGRGHPLSRPLEVVFVPTSCAVGLPVFPFTDLLKSQHAGLRMNEAGALPQVGRGGRGPSGCALAGCFTGWPGPSGVRPCQTLHTLLLVWTPTTLGGRRPCGWTVLELPGQVSRKPRSFLPCPRRGTAVLRPDGQGPSRVVVECPPRPDCVDAGRGDGGWGKGIRALATPRAPEPVGCGEAARPPGCG